MCRTRHFRWKWQWATEIGLNIFLLTIGEQVCDYINSFCNSTENQLLNTPHDRQRCHQAMTPLRCSSISTLCFPKKKWCLHFCDRGWGRQRYLPPRLRVDMATLTAIALDSSINLLFIGKILVDKEKKCWHHVLIRINHGLVCVVHINTLMCCLPAGLCPHDRLPQRDNMLGSWCQEHTPIHD